MFAAHPHSWAAKAEACAWLWARISFWPLFVAHELVLLPRRWCLWAAAAVAVCITHSLPVML